VKRSWLFVGLVALLAAIGSRVASASPDGLGRVAADLGFDSRIVTWYHAPFAGYAVPMLPAVVSRSVAGVVGAVCVGVVAWGLARWMATKPST
jgi:cobalt/nickel transport protein